MSSTGKHSKGDGEDNILPTNSTQSHLHPLSPVLNDHALNSTLSNRTDGSSSSIASSSHSPSPLLSHRNPIPHENLSSVQKGVDGSTPFSGPFIINNNNSNNNTERQYESKTSLYYHQYIVSPFQSFKIYLATSTPDRERNAASFHPLLRHFPPWLLPQYHGKKPVIKSVIYRPLCRLLFLAIIVILVGVASLFYSMRDGVPLSVDYSEVTDFDWTIDPRSYLSPMNTSFGTNYDVLLDGHSHSIYSDGRMSPETLLKWHIANGYNAVIVSDHNTIYGGLAAQEIALEKYVDKITVIPAMELSCCRLHMNLIGINETIDIAITKWPTDEQLKATIARTHELGGLAIINHIPWSNSTEYGYELPRMQHHPSREALLAMGIDGFEIANGQTLDTISLKFIQDNNLLLMTGTDVHYPDTNANSWTILNSNGNRSAESIMEQLRARRTSFLFDPTGTQPLSYPPYNEKYWKQAPPTLLGQYFQNFWDDQTGMYSFSPQGGFCHEEYVTVHYQLIGYFILWVFIAFLMFEAARLLFVGCMYGPYYRRKKYLKMKKTMEIEEMSEEAYHTDGEEAFHSNTV